ncbi:hypothetical protein BST81_25190 [Leptolyngbya sp. 'hensonii']|uniref:CmcI family methyltransferase n=1 Tax=Leptolyngbya sp. 'hensonii' TaxID=1922337 RepID=UPI00094F5FAC|nr:CmcI family methyltransferase [Leptolyngbya sp. 'hensonii']OLP15650.1 hypothetical protein BST81_25190 [Leptolyngbya sp. 'hensonii']
MPTVRIIVVQGPLQLLNVLSVLRSQAQAGEYQNCEDHLVMGGYRRDEQFTKVCLQIASIWRFKAITTLHDFELTYYRDGEDFQAATAQIKDFLGIASADVVYTCRNWQFINELFLVAYSEAHKICYGDGLGWLDLNSLAFYSTKPLNATGFVAIDEAHLIAPVDDGTCFDLCPIRLVPPEIFKSVVADSARQVEGLQAYCESLVEQLGQSITLVLTSYEFLAQYIPTLEEEVQCYLSCLSSCTQPGDTLLIKQHPRQPYEQAQYLIEALAAGDRTSEVLQNFRAVPIELFTEYLPIRKAITFGSSCCISLAYLCRCEVVIGYGEHLIRQFFVKKAQDYRLVHEYALSLVTNQAYSGSFTAIRLPEVEQRMIVTHKHPIRLQAASLIQHSLPINLQEQDVVNWFHQLYYTSAQQRGATWQKTYWMGQALYKCPLDLWIYQEILFKLKPELIIECGTLFGGSALFFAQMCDLLGQGEIVSIDIEAKPNRPEHPRISYWLGSSISSEIFERVQEQVAGKQPILIVLDSDHSARHVLDELRLYSRFVTVGSYIIVEDSNVNGHPVYLEHGPGPMEAIQAFLKENSEFYIDRDCEKFYLTMNPCGYLRRRSLAPSERALSHLKFSLTQYQKGWAFDEALANLGQMRQDVVDRWLALSPEELEGQYRGELGDLHRTLLHSGLRHEGLTTTEQMLLDALVARLESGLTRSTLPALLAAMLYQRADQLPLPCDLTPIPDWFLPDYLKFLFHDQVFFREVGEAERFGQYFQNWVNYLYESMQREPDSPFWHEVLQQFSQMASFIPLYFNELNLKQVYSQRADIMAFCLGQLYHQPLDYDFGGPTYYKKIRLGILATHYTPAAETFAALPLYECLSREFEVILYTLRITNHPLEQYCWSCVGNLKTLPEKLEDQVRFIRADDLDILFIAGNITAVTNSLCLLALYRLARVQVTSIASIVTTGMRHMDYYLSGQLTDPLITAQEHYREKLVKLAGSAHCFSYPSGIPYKPVPQVDRSSLGIADDVVVFVSSANFFKLVPELLHSWAQILASVPNALLMLLPFGPNWSDAYPKQMFMGHVAALFEEYGVTADRLQILDPQPVPDREGVKAFFRLADIYLDSYPFAGTTSLMEPLEVGLPTLTRKGNALRGAMGAALIEVLGLPDLVATSEAEYIERAIVLGQDTALRQQLRAEVEQQMQAVPAFLDSLDYAARLGPLFAEMLRGQLRESLKLRELNLILFPDWRAPEEELAADLAVGIAGVLRHPDRHRITLLVDSSNAISVEEADMAISSITMQLLMEEELEAAGDEPEISLISRFSEAQWYGLIPFVQARIPLAQENTAAIDQAGARYLPLWEPDR